MRFVADAEARTSSKRLLRDFTAGGTGVIDLQLNAAARDASVSHMAAALTYRRLAASTALDAFARRITTAAEGT
jgi:hypothetical protein